MKDTTQIKSTIARHIVAGEPLLLLLKLQDAINNRDHFIQLPDNQLCVTAAIGLERPMTKFSGQQSTAMRKLRRNLNEILKPNHEPKFYIDLTDREQDVFGPVTPSGAYTTSESTIVANYYDLDYFITVTFTFQMEKLS
jgi:hypothetical protein